VVAALAAAVLAAGCGDASSEGFHVEAPAGFKDQTGLTTRRSEAKIEALWQSADASIVVVRAKRPEGASLTDVMKAGQDLTRADHPDARIGPLAPAKLDGAPAARYDFTRAGAQARQLGAIHGDHVYLITFSAKPGAFQRRLSSLDGLLRSWRWD
jgi:hypothetical protein